MFVWTSIAQWRCRGEAGTNEIPNESAVLNAMQSSMGDKAGHYIRAGVGVCKNPSQIRLLQVRNDPASRLQPQLKVACDAITAFFTPTTRGLTLGCTVHSIGLWPGGPIAHCARARTRCAVPRLGGILPSCAGPFLNA